ncbi:Polyketide synthase [Madurella fahalii]|uniref:Polyketide synthase n=1 Tax=Madurella fahalii TaxID=1157608 RepID=A0ABQ0GGF8_9PEZI
MADQQPMPIAIVGMSCRLPGDVSTPGEFYRMLCRKRSGWSTIPPERFSAKAYHHPNPDKKGCFNSQGGYFIRNDISMFDAGFFDITKKEAESMDPAQRLLLECAYEALENAGMPKESVSGEKIGVFVGGNYTEHRFGNLRDLDHIPSFDATGNQGAFLAGRLAYYFNLRGPTFTVDTACSSSMHAIHLAVQSIRAGESEQAIVGASHLINHPDIWVSMAKLRLFSDAGKTYAFDHRAKSGYARGEGAGCLILKPLARAQADNDHIFSIITHTGISHNGRTVGIVAPSPEEQEQLLRNVLAEAKIKPEEIGFFETHGTGTKKGDPIEAAAIYKAVGSHFTPRGPLYIGSAKANVGHLECASGVVSVIKTVLMLYYGFILPNADFEKVNDAIPLDRWNMRVATEQAPWPGKRKYACVNNFGFNGSNSTCVLSAAPLSRDLELGGDGGYSPLRLFVLSANDETALRSSVKKLGIWLEQHAELYQTTMPRNLAYTLCQRRSHLPWRMAVVAGMCSDVARSLNSHDASLTRAPSEAPRLAFVYTGQGAQWFAMGRELLQTHPVFFEAISRADAALRTIGSDFSILEELRRDKTSSKVGLAHISQPICSAVQLALTDLLASFGIRPSAVTGHSSGEIGAAYAAGALTFESAMAAAYYRGQAIVELKESHSNLRGSMMAVGAGADELGPILKALNKEGVPQAVVACENSPSSTTLSGDEEAIDRVAKMFQEKGVFNRKLFVDVAYHSPHMKLIAESYLADISHITAPTEMATSNVEFYSSLRAQKVSLSELGPGYWVDNLTQAVRFSTATQHLCTEHSPDILIEIGPHAALKGPIMQILKKLGPSATKTSYLPTLVRGQDATRTCLEMAGQLFMRGYPLDFFEINHHREEAEKPALVPSLYTYPWSRQKYWYESRLSQQHRLKPFARHDLLGTLADWSSELEPTWRNVIRTDDLPWLKEYQIQSQMVFPVAGFVSMVVEAAAQQASLKGLNDCEFDIKNLRVLKQLFLADTKEFEVLLNFRPSENAQGKCHEFRVSSYETSRGWLEHCTGIVAAEPASGLRHPVSSAKVEVDSRTETMKRPVSEDDDTSSDSASSASKAPSSATSDAGNSPGTPDTLNSSAPWRRKSEGLRNALARSQADIYGCLKSLSISYPRSFQTLVEVISSEAESIAWYCARDSASDMPMEYETPYTVHPSIIDAMFQIPLLDLKSLDASEDGAAYLPSAIRHLIVRSGWSNRTSQEFTAHSAIDRRTGTYMVETFLTPGSAAAFISIAGVEFKALKPTPQEPAAPRELCFKFNWKRLEEAEPSDNDGGLSKPRAAVVIVTDGDDGSRDPLVAALAREIEGYTGSTPRISPLEAIRDWSDYFLVLSELKAPLLCSITDIGLAQVQKLLTSAPGVMWVTRGATRFPTMPSANMALGLIRTARSERSAVASTLDLDPDSKLDVTAQAALIRTALALSVLSAGDDSEMEFAEECGKLIVPRIVIDEKLNLEVHRSLGPSGPYPQDFYQRGRQLCLAPNVHGAFDDLCFEDAPSLPLADDEVEIAVMASVLSQDDIASCGGGDRNRRIARSCSGTVARFGHNVRGIPVGTRICALAEGRFGTHARARLTSIAVIPASLSMESGASIPIAFPAAYHALTHVAKLRPGERVLIQLSGPVGVAAIEVARYLGASAYVLVQSDEENVAASRSGVSLDRIFDARSIYLRRQLDEATQCEGMEVVLTLSGIGTTKAWECLADFGRFVEIRTADSHPSTRAELGVNATFTSVDMASIAVARPQVMQMTLKAIMENIESGAITPLAAAMIIPVSKLHEGLQIVREGVVQPVVAVARPHDQVKALHHVSKSIFRRGGTHVIIGGTGGLGRSMAKYMVEHGARNIVLVSRSGGGKELVEQLQHETQCTDARIVVLKCDVSVESQVWRLVGDCATTLPPICGVIHAAMVLRDGLLEGMTYEDYERVIRPKVCGAWNIHKVLTAYYARLDYFIVLSSAAGVLGSRGQAAYAAANTFLDSFVQFRVRNGLPGTALDLTAVTGAGYLAENVERQEDIIRNFGNETISVAEVLALLSAAVRGVCGPQCLTGLRLHLGTDSQWPYYASDPRFVDLKAECLANAEREGIAPKQAVSPGNAFRAAKSDEEAANIAAKGVLEKLSEVLTISIQDVDVARNITSYGLDSLTAIELRNWIAKELRANLQILELLSSGTIHDLAALIVQKTRTV